MTGPSPQQPATELLRFAAVGSVDDGKSTLIGRLLHDTKQLFDDQVEAVSSASRRRGVDGLDLSFVTDGLRAEREQGITIEVAYRYAATPRRKFVIADCPGHVQYTANMATGASTADLAVVVVDASTGLRQQTRRHCCIAALLGVRTFVVAANKMDLTRWDQAAFAAVERDVSDLARRLGVSSLRTVPVSALYGDNVVEPSANTPWYRGPTVLDALEHAPAGAWAEEGGAGARLAVQWVIRHPGGGRSYAGMLSGGALATGDEVVVLPAGHTARVARLSTFDGPLDGAAAGQSVTVSLDDDLDVARGDLIAAVERASSPVLRELDATVCWFGSHPLTAGQRHRLKHTTRTTAARIGAIEGRLDVDRLVIEPADVLQENDIGTLRLEVATPLAVDAYRVNRVTGSFVIIDEATNATVGAGLVGHPDLASEVGHPGQSPIAS